MNPKNVSVLVMDDECSTSIMQAAIERLEEEGFTVDTVETMGKAIESYYNKYYDVFVLDIDMSRIPDNSNEGDGVKLLKRFISLHNQTKVIMFSAAGTVRHWFESANAHCFAYVHKNEKNSIDRLVGFIHKSVEGKRGFSRVLTKAGKVPQKVIMYCENEANGEKAKKAVTDALGRWEINFAVSLDEMNSYLQKNNYGIALILQDVFELRHKEREVLPDILSFSPTPQIIIGCQGKDELQYSILFIANNHPFRIIDIERPNWLDFLEDSLRSAKTWYGGQEIFPAEAGLLERMNISIPSDALSEWEEFCFEENKKGETEI